MIAHLSAETRPDRPLDDENRKLLLALIRFGRKDTADGLLAAIKPNNKDWNARWLADASKDFNLDKCR